MREREREREIESEEGQRVMTDREWGERVIITVGWLDGHGFGQVKQFLHSGLVIEMQGK